MEWNTKLKMVTVSFMTLAFTGCTTVPLNTGAENVIFTTASPPQSCRFIDQISSTDTNGVSTAYTSHINLQTREINTLKNKALTLGANVVILTGHQTTYIPHLRTIRLVRVDKHILIGNAYACPLAELGTLPNVDSASILDAPQGN